MTRTLETAPLTDNPAIKGREGQYMVITVDAAKTLKSWKTSLFSFEWLEPNGSVRTLETLPLQERDKRLKVESALRDGETLPRPVLGIGLMDNIEIGAGREVFLTLAARGHTGISVHIPKSFARDFEQFKTP